MWQQLGSIGGTALGSALLPGVGGPIAGMLGGALGRGLGGLFGGRKRRGGGGGGQDSPEDMMRGLYGELSDPNYGMERMQRIAASSQPTLSDYFGMAAQRGGSMAQAQEQFNAGSQRGQAGAYGAMLDMEGQRMGQRAGLLGGLMDWEKAKMQDRMSLRSSGFSLLDNAMNLGGQYLMRDRPQTPSRAMDFSVPTLNAPNMLGGAAKGLKGNGSFVPRIGIGSFNR
jgi:hypothetical protein